MFKLAGAGLLGTVAARTFDQVGIPAAQAQDALAVKRGALNDGHRSLSHWIFLARTKLGGSVHAVDLGTGKMLGWLSYWIYGDTCPIPHHLAGCR